jgi:hypothetical protein
MRISVRWVAGRPSLGSVWTNPVAAGALCQIASSNRPSTTTGVVRATACTCGGAPAACAVTCAAAGAAAASRAARGSVERRQVGIGIRVFGLRGWGIDAAGGAPGVDPRPAYILAAPSFQVVCG